MRRTDGAFLSRTQHGDDESDHVRPVANRKVGKGVGIPSGENPIAHTDHTMDDDTSFLNEDDHVAAGRPRFSAVDDQRLARSNGREHAAAIERGDDALAFATP